MNNREWMILDALNVASTIHRQPRGDGYGATPEQICEVLAADERMIADYTSALRDINARSMSIYIGHLAGVRKGTTDRTTGFRPALVKRTVPGGGRFRLSDWGLRVMTA